MYIYTCFTNVFERGRRGAGEEERYDTIGIDGRTTLHGTGGGVDVLAS